MFVSVCALCVCALCVCVCDLDSLRSWNHTCNAIWAVTSRSENPHFNYGK
jgi:hypothetical protein